MRTARSSSRLLAWGCLPGGCLPQGELPGVCLLWGGVCARGWPPRGVYPSIHLGRHPPPLWTEWLTDRCKNITFPQLHFQTVTNVEALKEMANRWLNRFGGVLPCRTMFTASNGMREDNVFSPVWLSVCLRREDPYVAHMCLFILVHLGTPCPDLFKLVRYAFHTSAGRRMIGLRLKGLLVVFWIRFSLNSPT